MKLKLVTALAGLAIGASAQAAIVLPEITVTPTLAPNVFGSPSYAAWVSNSIQALKTGAATQGTAGTPTYYKAQSNVTASESIVTGFASWLGKADPATVFGPAFSAELGNRMLFGIKIDGKGWQFSIDQLSFSAASSDPLNALGFGFGAGSYNYSNDYVGVLKGGDGMLWTGDDVYVTSGPANQLVDGLLGRGSGNSFAAYCPGCTIAQQQQAIDDAASYITSPTSFTGTYSLSVATLPVVTGSGTFNISPVPEPATWALMIGGFAFVGASLRRRRTVLAFA